MEKIDLTTITPILEKIFRKKKAVLFCYVFGSFAYQNFNSESDVDIAVYMDKARVSDFFDERLELISEISQALGKEADILVLNSTPPFLKYVVLKEGKLIFSRDESKRIDFELKTTNEYFDFRFVLEKYNKRMMKL
ncbi:MAG: nucleotidyltransferase domain-containing protein [bacterium]